MVQINRADFSICQFIGSVTSGLDETTRFKDDFQGFRLKLNDEKNILPRTFFCNFIVPFLSKIL